MRKSFGMLMAMSLMMAGGGMPVYAEPGKRWRNDDDREPKKKLTPEENIELTKKKKEKFCLDIISHNKDRGERFKKWKSYEVKGINIVSSNFKNAYKTFAFTLKKNNLNEGDI